MEIIKVSTTIGKLDNHDEIFEALMGEVDTALSFTNETDFQFDFSGAWVDDIDLLEEQIANEAATSKTKFEFEFVNTHTEGIYTDKTNVSKIVDDYLGKRADIDNLKVQLEGTVEDAIKRTGVCLLDFINIIHIPRTKEGKAMTVSQGSGLILEDRDLLLLLMELKAKYGKQLIYTGLDVGGNYRVSFAMNFFTIPESGEIEYVEGDFVFVNKIELTPKDRDADYKRYDARIHDKKVKVKDLLKRTTMLVDNQELGIISEVTDEVIRYNPVKIINDREYSSTKKREKFKSVLEPEVKEVSIQDLHDRKYAIHGVDMTDEYQKLYALVEIANPPKERQVYYTKAGVSAYNKLTTPERDTSIDIASMERLDKKMLRELTTSDTLVHSVTSNL